MARSVEDEPLPEPDRIPGAPHPRQTAVLYGHGPAEQELLAAVNSGNLHHAFLLTGAEGIGKATLAWRFARFLLATGMATGPSLLGQPEAATTLDVPSDVPVARRIAALSEPRLFLLRRGANTRGNALSGEIRVDEVRDLADFLHLSAADGGRRVVIVDCADEMNVSSANALLKFLEEPPAGVTFLLVSHRPSALLPTIRSRCRELRLSPVGPDPLRDAVAATGIDPGADPRALAVLANGSPGRAVRLILGGGPELYAQIVTLFATPPHPDRTRATAFCEKRGRRGADEETSLTFDLLHTFVARLALAGAHGRPLPEAAQGEAALQARFAPDARAARLWAELDETLRAKVRHGRAVNLDPATLLLDMVLRISETAGRVAVG